ncbi:MAG: hypothetical protein ACUVV1_04785 [Fimbriimonadales bacterium]
MYVITDTGFWINIAKGNLVEGFLNLAQRESWTIVIPHVAEEDIRSVLDELSDPPAESLLQHSIIEVCLLSAEETLDLRRMQSEHPSLSFADLSVVLIAARLHPKIVLTLDANLRALAESRGYCVHGSLWILDKMVQQRIISTLQACKALKKMAIPPERLPREEVRKREKRWQCP